MKVFLLAGQVDTIEYEYSKTEVGHQNAVTTTDNINLSVRTLDKKQY